MKIFFEDESGGSKNSYGKSQSIICFINWLVISVNFECFYTWENLSTYGLSVL